MSFVHHLPFEWQIGVRYTRAGRRSGRNSFVSFMSLVSITGMALGVAALIVVLSIMNGFQQDVTGRMLSVLAHIEVYDESAISNNWQAVAQDARRNRAVLAAAPFDEFSGMLLQGDVMRPAVLRGILPAEESQVSEVIQTIISGSFEALHAGSNNVVLGSELASALHVKVGGQVALALAPSQPSLRNMAPQVRKLNVVGIFEAGHFEFDSGLAFMHLVDAQELLHASGPAGLRLRIADLHQAPQVAMQLKRSMNGEFLLRDWTQRNANWFAALQSQKHMMFIILTLIVAVAAFNVVAMLVMTVTDKRADVAILRTLGAAPGSIMKIFMVQGLLAGLCGIGAGVAAGVLVAWNMSAIVAAIEQLFGFHFLAKNIYFISSVPSRLDWDDVLGVAAVAGALSFLSTLYPSWWATRVNPAHALRYE
ncbi:lipoprotein-releasing ABC transporter permease subunit [Oxalobacteraceae bacterium]|nr:lipoprotein-releasing ABC transporter permease subunit [Oxalobacteraceae bacterium]